MAKVNSEKKSSDGGKHAVEDSTGDTVNLYLIKDKRKSLEEYLKQINMKGFKLDIEIQCK